MKGNKAHGYTAQMSILYHKVGKASILVVEAKALYIRRIRRETPFAGAQGSRWQYLHLPTVTVPNPPHPMSVHCDADSQLRGSFISDPISILRAPRTQTGSFSPTVGHLQIMETGT